MKIFFATVLICFFTMGHAPWGQHHIYRQIHMLIMCSKNDAGAFEYTKNLVAYFNDYLPKAKARAARAPHKDRVLALLKTNQIPLALFSYNYLNKITKDTTENFNFFIKDTRVLFFFPEMVLIANNDFPDDKAMKVFDVLMQGSNKNIYNNLKYKKKFNFFIPLDKSLIN